MKKILLSVCLGLMLFACGPRLIYPNLNWLIPWYVDDYISFNRSQNNLLAQRLAFQLDWHCRTQLAGYAEFLRELRQQFNTEPSTVTVEKLESASIALTGFWKNLVEQIGPDAAEIMATATDDQISELFANLEKQNLEMEQKYIEPSPDKVVLNRKERMVKRLRYWIQKPTPEQVQAVADWSGQLEPIAADWLAHRRKVQAEFQLLMRQRSDTAAFTPAFMDLLTHPEKLRTDDYQEKIDRNTQLTLELLIRLDSLLKPSQRRHLSNRLESLARDFDILSCDPVKKTGT